MTLWCRTTAPITVHKESKFV